MINQKKQNLKVGFYIITLIMFVISFSTIYKVAKNVNQISETLKLRMVTVNQLEKLYAELEPFMVARQQLLNELEKRDVSDVETVLAELNIKDYKLADENQVDREGFAFVTQNITINNMDLNILKQLMDSIIHEWPYINIQRVQILATENGKADLKIKLVSTEVL